MSKTIIISVSDIRNVLKATLADYWKLNGWTQPVTLVNIHGRNIFVSSQVQMEVCDLVLNEFLHELTVETHTDLRNAGQLVCTEHALTEHSVDERAAHTIAEQLFTDVVNTLGEHLPEITFSNHDGYSYQLKGPELWIYPRHI